MVAPGRAGSRGGRPAARAWAQQHVAAPALGLALLTAGLLLACPARAARRAEVTSVLRRMPDTSREAQATWLFDAARETDDAHVAFDLLSELTRRFRGPAAARARLWKVRFFMAAGDTASALRELQEVDDAPDVAAERAYWATLLGQESAGGRVERAGTMPPWELMRGIAALEVAEYGSRLERAALELEGAARRWGLLGPWLWRLVRSGNPVLREAAQAVADAPHASLAASPEVAGLREWFHPPEEPLPLGVAPEAAGPGGGGARETTFALEVGTFEEEEPARALVRELAGHGFDAYLATSSGAEGEPPHRVRVGRGCSRTTAESLGTALGRKLMLSYQIVPEEIPEAAEPQLVPDSTGSAPSDSTVQETTAPAAEPDTARPDPR